MPLEKGFRAWVMQGMFCCLQKTFTLSFRLLDTTHKPILARFNPSSQRSTSLVGVLTV